MGFVDTTTGVRAIGYLERNPLPAGPIALVTHSGSVFSALLRTHRRLGFTVAVSSGQELVTTTADHLAYALVDLAETRSSGWCSRRCAHAGGSRPASPRRRRGTSRCRARRSAALGRAGGPSSTRTPGRSPGPTPAWEALFTAYGVHRCTDLDDLTDSLEIFAIGRRPVAGGRGLATVHDSGAERVLVADVAERLGVPFATLSPATVGRARPSCSIRGSSRSTRSTSGAAARTRERLFGDALAVLADDPAVGAVALAVDLVEEYDGDDSFPRALQTLLVADAEAGGGARQPAVRGGPGGRRAAPGPGIPVLEGTRRGCARWGTCWRVGRPLGPRSWWTPPGSGSGRERLRSRR